MVRAAGRGPAADRVARRNRRLEALLDDVVVDDELEDDARTSSSTRWLEPRVDDEAGDTVKVVLRTDVPGVGKRGDITEVSDGFARNYLVPQGRAIVANVGHRGPGRVDAPLTRPERCAQP